MRLTARGLAYLCVLLVSSSAYAVTLSPTTLTVQENAGAQFIASVPSTWSATCGIVTSAGQFTAPLYPSITCTVTATATNGSGTATAKVTVVSPITMSPVSATTPSGRTQQFTASVPVTWKAACGSITATGLYTASGTAGTSCTIEGIATGSIKYTVYGFDTTGPASSLTISPVSPSLMEGARQQFTASSSTATYSASCGTITSAGLYTAPLVPESCLVTAKASNGNATATVTVNPVITVTPSSVTTPQGSTQQFTASAGVTWSASCGTMSSSGLFTSTGVVGSICSIKAVSSSSPAYTSFAYDTIGAANAVTPSSVTLNEGGTQQFAASVPSTWAATCGAITSAGLFTAPLYPSATCVVTATATGSNNAGTAKPTIVSPVVMSPASATTPQGETQQFTSNAPVTWTTKCGTISSTGLYTASAVVGTTCTIEGIATGTVKYTVYGFDVIGAAPAGLTLSPLAPSLTEGGTQQFTTSLAAKFAASCGTISSAGLYTAPFVAAPCTITATASDGSGRAASTIANVTSPIAISPASATTAEGQTQQFTANTAVTWTTSCGSISKAGLYTASAAQGDNCSITATAATGEAYVATAVDTIGAPLALTVTPQSPTLGEGATQQFAASVAATWTASCGQIDPSLGSYTAPLAPESCTITATATDGSGHISSTVATISAPLTVSPSTATTGQGQTQLFTANTAVDWSSSCGSINSNGLFTASAPLGSSCTVTATAANGTPYTAMATDNIGQAPSFTLSPLSPTLSENATQQFTTSLSATFTSSCGTIDPNLGFYTAPLVTGPCTITATEISDSSKTASTTVIVTSPLVITPISAATPAESTQQFSTNMPATWQASCGSIDASGFYSAPNSPGSSCTITAIATGSVAYTSQLTDTIGSAPTLAITPNGLKMLEAATQQFSANVPVTFSATCGSIDPSLGTYVAPLFTGNCTITATATDGSGNTASSLVQIASPLVITPASASTEQSQTQQFGANMAATWATSCGTVDQTGSFTATGPSGSVCQITATSTGSPAYTASVFDTISAAAVLSLSPQNPGLSEDGTQQFTTNIPAAFTATCGTIDPNAGSYTAPLVAGACTVTATSTDASAQVASTTVTVTTPLLIQPSTADTALGLQQQFSANQPVTWVASCGTIDPSLGLYTATSPPGSSCTITATASNGIAYTATATETIAGPPVLSVAPLTPTLSENSVQQFTSNVAATFTATCGSIGITSGTYTAPLSPGNCTITATPVYGAGNAASAIVTITSPVIISPAAAVTAYGTTQQFIANMAVNWSSSCGSITPAGLFTPPGTSGSVCSITATSSGPIAYGGVATDTASAGLTISPTSITLSESAAQQFSATIPATWSASCGTIDPNLGSYQAPLTVGTCTITANATDGSSQTTSSSVTVTSPITLTPASANLHALNPLTFTSSQAVSWATSCGAISNAGVFTAPPGKNSCTITATATTSPAYTQQATVNVDVVNQVRWRNSQQGTGLQSNELLLTPGNVNSSSFGQVWSATVDGGVWAEPLYMNAVTINGAPHNVVFVGTDNDSMYALDADSGVQLWKTSLIPAGATAVTSAMTGDVNISKIGILGTPAIDDGVLYVVAETAEQNATYFPHRLHALDVTTGNEVLGGPVLVSNPSLQPIHKLQRPGLTIASGNIYVAFGSLADTAPYTGLIFSFNETSLAQESVWITTPTGSLGGIWQAGGAPSVDSSGNVYALTGNGTADGVSNFGESAVKLSASLQMLDFFSPYNAAALTKADLDLGSASVPVMPDQNGSYPHELIFCSKTPVIYVLNRDSMGQMGTTKDNIVQFLPNVIGGTATGRDPGQACFTSPSAWGQYIYFVANGDVIKQFTLDPNTGTLSNTPTYQGSFSYGWPGSQSMISSNGSTNGIIWTFDNVGKTLHADNASNVSIPLYISPAIKTGYLKWTTPTVINGHVYVGADGVVVAFSVH